VVSKVRSALGADFSRSKRNLLEMYLADFSVLRSDDFLCSTWAEVRNESIRKGHRISAADAWIAATLLVLSAPNPRDYQHLDELQIVCAAGG